MVRFQRLLISAEPRRRALEGAAGRHRIRSRGGPAERPRRGRGLKTAGCRHIKSWDLVYGLLHECPCCRQYWKGEDFFS